MRFRLLFSVVLLCHCLLLPPFAENMATRPVEVRLGYIPHPQILKMITADHDLLVSGAAVIKVLFYYGTVVEEALKKVIIRPEYYNMYQTVNTAVELDPYNQDAYYFSQAAFTWELGRVREVNAILEKGLLYRTWDPWIPFYLGFNHAYFLKDYAEAARYMQIAAERSGNPLFAKLAARYFYEAKQTDLGLLFLETLIDEAKDKAVKNTYKVRRDALMAVSYLEEAISAFVGRYGHLPKDLQTLVAAGIIEKIPVDPYGGRFYLDPEGRVRSTSKLADPNL